jgi:monooxygenase
VDPDIQADDLLALNSGYVQRSLDKLPRQGTRAPWRLKHNYVVDLLTLRNAKLEDGVLELRE